MIPWNEKKPRVLTAQLRGRIEVVRAVNVIVHLQLQLRVLLQQVQYLLFLERSLFQDDYGICPLSGGAGYLQEERIKLSANSDPVPAGEFETRDNRQQLAAP